MVSRPLRLVRPDTIDEVGYIRGVTRGDMSKHNDVVQIRRSGRPNTKDKQFSEVASSVFALDFGVAASKIVRYFDDEAEP